MLLCYCNKIHISCFVILPDLFHTRVQPSKMFDVLKEDFEYWLIACVLGVMLLVSVISQKLSGRRALQKAWK